MLKIDHCFLLRYSAFEDLAMGYKDVYEHNNKKFGLHPRDNIKLKWAFSFKEGRASSEFDDSAYDTTYLSEDIMKYLHREKIINDSYLVFLCAYNENIGIKFLYWIIDNVENKNVLINFDCELIRTNGYEQIYNFEMNYPNLICKDFIYIRPKNSKEKQFYNKLLSLHYQFYKPRYQNHQNIKTNCNIICAFVKF